MIWKKSTWTHDHRTQILVIFGKTQTKGPNPNLFQHGDAPVHKARSIKTWFAKTDVKNSSGLHRTLTAPSEHLWDEFMTVHLVGHCHFLT